MRVVVAGLVVLALPALLFLAAERGQRSGRGTMPFSSFRPDDSGLRAARLVLEGIGFPVESRRGAKLPSGAGHVLIRVGIAAPTDQRPPEELAAERKEIADWIAAGNALLLFGDGDHVSAPSGLTPPPTGAGEDDDAEPDDEAEPNGDAEPDDSESPGIVPRVRGDAIVPGSVVQNSVGEAVRQVAKGPDVPTTQRYVVVLAEFDDVALPWITPGRHVEVEATDDVWVKASDSADALIVEREHGDGYVVVVADPFFASNLRLAQSDNAAWIAAIVARLRDHGTVWFDDRAVGQTASRGVLSLLTERGLGPALLCGLGLLLLVWWRSGPSDAPLRATAPRQEYRPESYAHLRAGLYVDCIDEGDIRRVVRDEVRRRLALGERTGFERALDMLATRHPERADAIRDALAEIPADPRTTYRKYPETWTRAVAHVWRALDALHPDRAQSPEGEDQHGTTREPSAS